ncbi:sugar ABC transporter permease [Lachnoclostridium pacaense]|uniref:carbohydrate ABC transporter permease n=1 Tax=Enterocloster hominis (ex Hitch et al. 2024) TaxID=1917870 RepID=UPI001D0F6C02|nr:sugar ABC transporter permease [Lachnoclostridium pacaense]MCC2874928.1 sugar ABC transporter permease [Lachnoclostridium pacaense]
MKLPKISIKQARIHGGNLLFLLPAFVLFAFVVILPFLQGIPYSFTNWKSVISTDYDYVGFSNYITLIKNRYFQQAFIHTFQFATIYVTGANILGLGLALLLNGSKWYTNIARTVVFIPFTVALTSGAIVWSYVYTDIISPLFNIISPLGVSSQVIPAMAVIAIWRDMGYCMMIYIAALQSIPNEYYDAAKVDGANWWQRVKGITFPLIIPAIISNVTLLVAWGLKCFDYPMAVARNMEAAQTAAMYVYDNIFGFNKAGLGQAAAIIITVVLVILTYAITAVCNKLEVEE